MKTLKNIIIFFLLVTVSFSCEDFLDVNDDPDNPAVVALELRLKPAILMANGAALWRGMREVMLVTQYGASESKGFSYETWKFTNRYFIWQNTFVWAYPNAVDLIVLGEDQNSPHFSGTGKILKAYLLFLLSDQLGSIPYDDLYNGRAEPVLEPRFEDQQVIYEKCLALLDEAIVDLSSADNDIDLNKRDGDIIYQGITENWIKFAYALKARALNHYTKKSSLYDTEAVIAACANAFDGDGQDAEFPYDASGSGTQKNPFSPGGYGDVHLLANSYSNFFISMLQASPLTNDSIDPRLPIITSPSDTGSVYRGIVSGMGTDTLKLWDYSPFQGGFYTNGASTIPFITYSEVKFIEAEAKFRSADLAGAKDAFKEGVLSNLRKLGVNALLIAEAATSIDALTDFDTKALHYIMTQKYIAIMLNPETWVDMRRMDYDSTIYPGLIQPAYVNNIFEEDEWIRALPYEYNEENRNPDNVPNNSPSVRLKTPVWWDVAE